MRLSRRSLLSVVGTCAVSPAFAQGATATDPRLGERSFGHPDAPASVTEFFSLTCTHCAAFSREVMPQVTTDLIDTGKLRIVYRDFPLDQVALTAAMIARALPADRYEPFISALFASQDRWAFAQGVNSTAELAKMAILAGMSRPTFEATIADTELKQWILTSQQQAETQFHVDSTPTFLSGDKTHPGEMGFDAFVKFATGLS
jgi:protein-disulfide isomerase